MTCLLLLSAVPYFTYFLVCDCLNGPKLKTEPILVSLIYIETRRARSDNASLTLSISINLKTVVSFKLCNPFMYVYFSLIPFNNSIHCSYLLRTESSQDYLRDQVVSNKYLLTYGICTGLWHIHMLIKACLRLAANSATGVHLTVWPQKQSTYIGLTQSLSSDHYFLHVSSHFKKINRFVDGHRHGLCC